jgi:hypothetical protein
MERAKEGPEFEAMRESSMALYLSELILQPGMVRQ